MLSMTGYGEAQRDELGLNIRSEVRSVNNRHLKLSSRLPDGYGAVEPQIEALVRSHVHRGSVQLNLTVSREASEEDYQLNSTVLTRYYEQLLALQSKFGQPEHVSLELLLQLPGVVESSVSTMNAETEWPIVKQTIEDSLQQLNQMRGDEGQSLAVDLHDNCAAIANELSEIEALAPRTVAAYEQRLLDRINQSNHDNS